MRFLPEKILVLGFVIALPLLVIWKITVKEKVLGTEVVAQKDYKQEEAFWEDQVIKNPEYRDGYVQLAKTNLEEGDLAAARHWLDKALEIDPNFQVPVQLQSLQQVSQ